MKSGLLSRDPRRGGALITVVIFTSVMALLAASLLRYVQTENKLNLRSRLLAQSRYLAESVVDYGFAQMTARFVNQSNLPSNEFQARPLRVPRDSFVDGIPADESRFEIVAGTIPNTATFGVVDPNDPNNIGDPLRGQIVFTREINVYGRAAMQDPSTPGARIESFASQRLQVRDAPLFANAIFYHVDLELSPGAPMDVYGSVHSNRGLYLVTDSVLRFHDSLTSAGRLYHGAAPGSGRDTSPPASKAANIRIDKPSGSGVTAVDMYAAPHAVQSTMPEYRSVVEDRWARRVQTTEHGIQPQLPIAVPDPAPSDDTDTPRINEANPGHTIIAPSQPLDSTSTAVEREIEEQRYAAKAGLRIVVNPRTGAVSAYKRTLDTYGNTVKDGDGNVEETPVTLPAGLVTTGARMFDQRRNTNTSNAANRVYIADIDIGKLKQVIETPGAAADERITGFATSENWNGVVYIESSNTNNTGIRLINGGSIPDPNRTTPISPGGARGLTVATNNAMYVKGHYNADGSINNSTSSRYPDDWDAVSKTAGEPPAAIVADAITLLSNNWDDARSGQSLSNRTPTNTEISAALLTGIVRSSGGTYSGGVENFPRFLENWSGRTVAIRGSMVCLFESVIAHQPWRGTGTVYNAPNRVWGFNELFRTGVYPPGTPVTRTYRRIHYRTLTEAEYEDEVSSFRASS